MNNNILFIYYKLYFDCYSFLCYLVTVKPLIILFYFNNIGKNTKNVYKL